MRSRTSRILFFLAHITLVITAVLLIRSQTAVEIPSRAADRTGLGVHGSRTVPLPDSVGSIELPSGFRKLTPEEAARTVKDGEAKGPRHAYVAFGGEARIIVRRPASGRPVTTELEKWLTLRQRGLARKNPTLHWITREITEFGGRQWVHLEFSVGPPAKGTRYHLFDTIYQGGIVRLEISATASEYRRSREVLLAAARSVRLEPEPTRRRYGLWRPAPIERDYGTIQPRRPSPGPT